jgi:uncharacterized protein with PIN domain
MEDKKPDIFEQFFGKKSEPDIFDKEFGMNECKSCGDILRKYKKWNERKVPSVAITMIAECAVCHKKFEIYNDMCQELPPEI